MIFSKIMGRILRTEPQQGSHDLGHKISNENVPVPRVAPAANVASMRRSPGPADQPGGLVRPVLRRRRDQDHGGYPGVAITNAAADTLARSLALELAQTVLFALTSTF